MPTVPTVAAMLMVLPTRSPAVPITLEETVPACTMNCAAG